MVGQVLLTVGHGLSTDSHGRVSGVLGGDGAAAPLLVPRSCPPSDDDNDDDDDAMSDRRERGRGRCCRGENMWMFGVLKAKEKGRLGA
eukprot:1131437-Rhodomonas_salina.1